MPATSSAPGSQPESVARRNTRRATRSAVSSLAHQTATAVSTGQALSQAATQTARATATGYAQPQAPTLKKARRVQQRQRAKRQELTQRTNQIERALSHPAKAQRQLTSKTAKLAKRIAQDTQVDLPTPKVKLGEATVTAPNKVTVAPKLAKAILQERPHAQATLAKAVLDTTASHPAPPKAVRQIARAVRTGVQKRTPVFRKEAPSQYKAAAARNRKFAKPAPYTTDLDAKQEADFRHWVKSNKVPFDPDARRSDYDMRAYWLAHRHKDYSGGHFPDTYKTPFDTTFSGESQYANKRNPFVWHNDKLVNRRTKQVVFDEAQRIEEDAKPKKPAPRKAKRAKVPASIPDVGNARQVAPLVRRQAKKHDLPPSVLMSQIQHESNFDPSAVSSAGAEGETQFMPGTAPSYGVKFGTDPKAVRSQIKGQAKFMGELLDSKGNLSDALAAYNAGPAAPASAAGTYPQDILADAAQYAALDKGRLSSKPVPKQSVTRLEAITDEAKKIDSAQLPYSLGAGHVSGKVPGPSKTIYDCSSAVSRVLQAAGVKLPGALVSGDLATTPLLADGPGAVTIYANAEHVFMKIGNRYWGTSHSNPEGGAGFIPTSYEQGEAQSGNYVVRHVPGLGQDIARRMGIRLTPGGSPGLSVSSSGTTATITDGVIRNTPGTSSKPIKLDRSTLRAKAQKQKAKRLEGRQRSKFIRSLISSPPSQTEAPIEAPTSSYDTYLNRKVSISS